MDIKEKSPFNFDELETNATDGSPFSFDQPKTDDTFSLGEESDFDFDTPESSNFEELDENANLNETIVLQHDLVRTMDCICPKCTEKTEVDLALMPEDGFVINCSSCNKQINIVRESSVSRANRKSYTINCANCGKSLDPKPHCHSCGLIFPDYFLIFDPSVARKKVRNNLFSKIKEIDFSFNKSSNTNSQSSSGYSPQSKATDSTTTKSRTVSRKHTLPAIIFIVLLTLIGGGIFAYKSYTSGVVYAENYFKALYCIKTGVETNISECTILKTEWESASTSGRSFTPTVGHKDEAKSAKLHGDIDKYMQKLNEPPRRFAQANENLKKIHKIYLDAEAIAQSKPNSILELASSVDELSKRMSQATEELKSNLPAALNEELKKVRLKYRGMKDF